MESFVDHAFKGLVDQAFQLTRHDLLRSLEIVTVKETAGGTLLS